MGLPGLGRERHGDPYAGSLIDRILHDATSGFADPGPGWDLHGYVADALTSGWPEALRAPSERARDRWLAGYIDHLVTREAPSLGLRRDPTLMRRYLQILAANTAGLPAHKLLYDAAGIDRLTATGYDNLLDTLMITHRVPAWSGNRTDRAMRTAKRYLIDAGLLGPLLGVDHRRAFRDSDLLGRILDTLVAAQLRAECAISVVGANLFHLRDANGRHEVDILIEARDGRLIGVEIKATAAPTRQDARHLEWLRDRVGPRLAASLLVHTGPRLLQLTEQVLAVPIASLWSWSER